MLRGLTKVGQLLTMHLTLKHLQAMIFYMLQLLCVTNTAKAEALFSIVYFFSVGSSSVSLVGFGDMYMSDI